MSKKGKYKAKGNKNDKPGLRTKFNKEKDSLKRT